MKKVLVFGTFDKLHPGHLYFFHQAKKFGCLTVVVARDKTVKKTKNKKPSQNEKQRAAAIRELKIATKVILGSLGNKYAIIKKIKPDIICLGYDQKFFVFGLKKKIKKFNLKTKILRLKSYKPNIYKSSHLRNNKMKILWGQPLAEKIYQQIRKEKKGLKIKPGLAVIMVGKNESSRIYVGLKEQAARKLGFYFKKYLFSDKVSEKKILSTIGKLNQDQKIHGLIIQLPLPKKFNAAKIIKQIRPNKDVDGFHHQTKFLSPVHQAILKLLSFYKIKIKNRKTVILVNSLTFAQPLQKILKKGGSRVKIILKNNYSSYSREYGKYFKKADILIIVLGKPRFLKEKMIKNGAIIIDVGYSRINKRALGDVDFKSCRKKASAISPVPGGVGPLTVAYLIKNVLKSAQNQ